jgi:hypothetical protein
LSLSLPSLPPRSPRATLRPQRPGCHTPISYANRNEKSHLPYGEGTLRAEPLAEALARFDRPAIVMSEASDEASSQTVRAILVGEPAPSATSSSPRLF